MKKYSVKSVQMCPVDLKKIDWSKAEIAEIREYPWPDWKEGQTYFPECNARVMRVVNSDGVPEGIVAKLSCKESDPTAIYHNFYDYSLIFLCIS